MNPEDFNFEWSKDREAEIVFDEAAKTIVPIYKAFLNQGLTPLEAAHLVAAMTAQTSPLKSPDEQNEE